MMETNEYESGLNMLEELTTNAQQIQDQLLGEILSRNAGSEYLRRFLHGQADKQLFKKNVPIASYEDIKPYIDRIANGEASSHVLSAETFIGFFLSTGTSGGQPKLIPVTAESANRMAMFNALRWSLVIKHVGDIDEAGKRMELMFAKPEVETPCGLKASAVSTRVLKGSRFRAILPKLYTSPFETIFCPDTKQSMYCQLLFGLLQRDEVFMIGSIFASTVLRSIKFLENNWQELCSNIRTGQISDWITDLGCRTAAASIMKPDSDLAYLIENICRCKSWDGIIRKLWPKTKYIGAICTGAMMQYTAELEFYCGGLPLVSGFYGCSEGVNGINLEPLCKPSDVSYTFLPDAVYYEFVPIEEESVGTKSNDKDTKPVDLVNVKPGRCYELLVTSSIGRQNVGLCVDVERTSESDILKALTEAKILLDQLGLILTEYTSYGDTSSTPGHYVIFWELKAKEGNNGKELDPKVMEACCSRIEDSLHFTYRRYRKENIIAALEIRVVKQGTFEALMDYFVSRGPSLSQYKTPICIKPKEALKILDSRVIAKFFSQKTPTI
ncbi:hypothetical protein GQ457_01G049630 [Hibiscus cannabinus]